jgi:hypothetical protein
MKKKIPVGFFILILFSMLIGSTRCSTTKMVYNKIIPDKGGLKKRVLVLPLIDQAGLDEAKVKEINDLFLEALRKDDHFLIQEASMPPSSKKNSSPSPFDILVNPTFAKWAESKGVNVLISATLHPIDVNSEKKGFWPILLIRQNLELSMAVNALDLANGTLFMTNLESTKLKMEKQKQMEGFEVLQIESDYKEDKKDEPLSHVSDKKIQKALTAMVENQASAILDVLREEPWSGKILSIDGQRLIINAGRDVGLIMGSLFEVFGEGESIQSVNGRTYNLLGPKLGEIKVVQIKEDQASAVPWKGEGFKAGQTIRIKD